MVRRVERLAARLLCVAAGVSFAACSSPKPASTETPATPATPSSSITTASAALWGDMKPLVSVKELMKYMIDPVSDGIFLAVSETTTKAGTIVVEPKTDEDWDRIQSSAVSLAEGIYLLKVKRPFTPPGDENNSQGPDAVELSPAQILAKVERDPVEWNARIEALRNVALEVLEIVKRRDKNELWEAGENLEEACEACHRSYWYPGEGKEFYQKLRRRLDEMSAQRARRVDAARSQRQ